MLVVRVLSGVFAGAFLYTWLELNGTSSVSAMTRQKSCLY